MDERREKPRESGNSAGKGNGPSLFDHRYSFTLPGLMLYVFAVSLIGGLIAGWF